MSTVHGDVNAHGRVALMIVCFILTCALVFVVSGTASAQSVPNGSTAPASTAPTGTTPLSGPSPATATRCPVFYACQFADTSYGGDFDYYRYGYNNFQYATNNNGDCIQRGKQNWNDCARSTYSAHTSASVGWFVTAGCTGRELINTPDSGSPNLSDTYMGNFYEQLSSIEYFGTPARCS